MKRMMTRNLGDSLAGLKHHVETGNLVAGRVPAEPASGS